MMTHPGRRSVFIAVLFMACLATSSCWIPEKFDAGVSINKDGSYTFTYDGTLAFAPALAAVKEGGLPANEEANLKQEAAKMRQEPGFKKVDYQGNGRYKVLVEKTGKPGETFCFVSCEEQFFTVISLPNGTTTVKGVRPSAEGLKQLNEIGATLDGTLSVSTANGMKVIKHNAESEPMFFGWFGSYKWHINSVGADPFIVVQPAS